MAINRMVINKMAIKEVKEVKVDKVVKVDKAVKVVRMDKVVKVVRMDKVGKEMLVPMGYLIHYLMYYKFM